MEGTDSGLLNTNKTHSDGFEGGVETGVFSRIFRFFCLFLIFWGDEREEELRGGEENIAESLTERDVAGGGFLWPKEGRKVKG